MCMVENVCKNCNAPLDMAEAKNGVIVCAFCGSAFTLPKKEQPPAVVKALDFGYAALDKCRFDDAYTHFASAAELDGSEPEAYWGKALAKFRVQYLRDTVNNRLQPICHEMSGRVFREDRDCVKALELATDEQRAEYAKKAEEIDYIRKEFHALERTGLDYDCFICVKVTDESGNPTRDSLDATRIYMGLKEAGYKPFFSEYEIRGRAGADYEAMILYALYMSESMLVVCSDEEYLKTKWVKNEYTRFAELMGEEKKEGNSITIAFRGGVIERLPGVKGKIQGISLTELDAMDRIRAFIDSHDAEKQRKKAEREAAEREARERKEAEEREKIRAAAEAERKAAEEAAKARAEAAEKRAAEMERRLKELEAAQNAPKSAPKNEPKNESKSAPKNEPKPAAGNEPKPAPAKPAAPVKPATGGDFGDIEIPDPAAPAAPAKAANPAAAAGFEIKDGVLIKYKGTAADVTIPAGVQKIEAGAFKGCTHVTSVVFGIGVQTVGEEAFSGCMSLASVTVPPTLKRFEKDAFKECTNLARVNIADLASWCTTFFKTSAANPLSRTAISDDGKVRPGSLYINGRHLTELTIPAGVTKLGWCTFYNADIERVTIPSGVKEIGQYAFSGCENLTEMTVAADNATYKSVGNCIMEKATGKIIVGCNGSVLPQNAGVKAIAPWAFYHCRKLKRAEIPATVVLIGNSAFCGCAALADVTIPDGLTTISQYAFHGNKALKSLYIPASVATIGDYAFSDCYDLTLYCAAAKKQAGWYADIEKRKLVYRAKRADVPAAATPAAAPAKPAARPAAPKPSAPAKSAPQAAAGKPVFKIEYGTLRRYDGPGGDVVIPAGVKMIGAMMDFAGESGVFQDRQDITSVTIPAGVTKIGNRTFSGCTALAAVTIPTGVTKIGDRAFSGCTALTQIALPNSLKEIGNHAFEGCTGLKRIVLPAGLQSISVSAFQSCTALEAVDIPDSVTELWGFAFMGCKNLARVTLPAGLDKIDHGLFSDCERLQSIVLPAGVKEIEHDAFRRCKSLAGIVWPQALQTIGSWAFDGCESLPAVSLPDGVTAIGHRAFSGCKALKELRLSAALTVLASSAFSDCTALADVCIPDKVTEIGAFAFLGDRVLKTVSVPGSVKKIGDTAFGYGVTTITVRGKKPLIKPLGWHRHWKGVRTKVVYTE